MAYESLKPKLAPFKMGIAEHLDAKYRKATVAELLNPEQPYEGMPAYVMLAAGGEFAGKQLSLRPLVECLDNAGVQVPESSWGKLASHWAAVSAEVGKELTNNQLAGIQAASGLNADNRVALISEVSISQYLRPGSSPNAGNLIIGPADNGCDISGGEYNLITGGLNHLIEAGSNNSLQGGVNHHINGAGSADNTITAGVRVSLLNCEALTVDNSTDCSLTECAEVRLLECTNLTLTGRTNESYVRNVLQSNTGGSGGSGYTDQQAVEAVSASGQFVESDDARLDFFIAGTGDESVRRSTSEAAGPFAVAIGRAGRGDGAHATQFGYFTYADTNASVVAGYRTWAKAPASGRTADATYGQFASGAGEALGNVAPDEPNSKPIIAEGFAAFIHSTNDAGQTDGHGSRADSGAILGGINADLNPAATGTVLLASNGTKAPATFSVAGALQAFTYKAAAPEFVAMQPGAGYVLRSPNGDYHRVSVSDAGGLLLNGNTTGSGGGGPWPPLTNPLTDDVAKVLRATLPDGIAATDCAYTLDSGATYANCTAGMQSGNDVLIPVSGAKQAGTVGVRVRAGGGKTASATVYNPLAFTAPAVPLVWQEDNVGITYTGAWYAGTNLEFYAAGYKATSEAGATASFRMPAGYTKFSLQGHKDPGGSYFEVTVNGVQISSSDQYEADNMVGEYLRNFPGGQAPADFDALIVFRRIAAPSSPGSFNVANYIDQITFHP